MDRESIPSKIAELAAGPLFLPFLRLSATFGPKSRPRLLSSFFRASVTFSPAWFRRGFKHSLKRQQHFTFACTLALDLGYPLFKPLDRILASRADRFCDLFPNRAE